MGYIPKSVMLVGVTRRQSNSLKIVVIGQFLTRHDATIASEESHARFPSDSPLLHPTVGLTRVIDEAGDGASSGINDHILIKVHQIVALERR